MDHLSSLARALMSDDEEQPLRLMYGVASGANTVVLDGSSTSLTLPAIVAVASGDYVAVLGVGSDRLILGPVT